MAVTIPVVMCIRPSGRREAGTLWVPEGVDVAKIEEQLVLFGKYGIKITIEEIPGNQANVCLDNGDFDYKYELFPADDTINQRVAELVLNFDEADYLKAVEAFDD